MSAAADFADELPEALRPLLAAAWPEATRALSPRGLDNWLKGALALERMGRGPDPAAAWIEAVPALARSVGEDVIADFAQRCMSFASRTSGAVIALVVATAPRAAERLGDSELFRAYLQLIDVLLAQAPRGLRPLLENLDPLLAVLTLGGLRRWALWGAQAHRTDFEAQKRYFSLASEESKAVLQKERKGTLLVDVQRRLGMYLRALWGRDFFLRPSAEEGEAGEGGRPFIADGFLHLPDACDDWHGIPGLDLYRAAAAHGAAHLAATRRGFDADRLDPLQRICVGLIEDARAEALAIRRFPRLRELWLQFHRAGGRADGVGARLDAVARALLDPARADPLAARICERFATADLDDAGLALELGLALSEDLRGQPFSLRHGLPSAPYRDDNRYLWNFDSIERFTAAGTAQPQVRKYVSTMEMINVVEVETAGDDAQEIWVLAEALFDDDGIAFNAREGREPVAPPRHYDEFDYHLQLSRPAWATVVEKRPRAGDPALVEALIEQHRRLAGRLERQLEALQPQGVQRLRKLEEGDEVDIDAAIRSLVDHRLGFQPDPRVMMRSLRKVRDITVLVLLDLSESTNDRVAGQEHTVLELTRAATALLAEAIARVGDPFAIHSFCSDGRHQVFYQRHKDFGQPWNGLAKAHLAGMEGRLSTRMGAAVRHAGRLLAAERAAKKLLLVVTDGEPADIDVRDPQYLRFDARKAVEEVGRDGVLPFCLSLDPRADPYVARIFGQRNYLIVDHVVRLPERLPQLYAGLTR